MAALSNHHALVTFLALTTIIFSISKIADAKDRKDRNLAKTAHLAKAKSVLARQIHLEKTANILGKQPGGFMKTLKRHGKQWAMGPREEGYWGVMNSRSCRDSLAGLAREYGMTAGRKSSIGSGRVASGRTCNETVAVVPGDDDWRQLLEGGDGQGGGVMSGAGGAFSCFDETPAETLAEFRVCPRSDCGSDRWAWGQEANGRLKASDAVDDDWEGEGGMVGVEEEKLLNTSRAPTRPLTATAVALTAVMGGRTGPTRPSGHVARPQNGRVGSALDDGGQRRRPPSVTPISTGIHWLMMDCGGFWKYFTQWNPLEAVGNQQEGTGYITLNPSFTQMDQPGVWGGRLVNLNSLGNNDNQRPPVSIGSHRWPPATLLAAGILLKITDWYSGSLQKCSSGPSGRLPMTQLAENPSLPVMARRRPGTGTPSAKEPDPDPAVKIITLLAIVGHSLGLLLVFAQRRAVAFISRHRANFLRYLRNTWVEAITALITGSLYTFHSSLSWVPWMHYYFICRDGYLPSLWNIRRAMVLSLDSIPLESVFMIVTPVAIHALAMCLCNLSFAHVWFPLAARTIARDVDRLALTLILGGSAFGTAVWYCHALFCFWGMEQKSMGDDVKYWLGDLEMQMFSSAEARAEIWDFWRLSRERHKTWRITQSKEAFKIMRLLWMTAWSTWEALPWAQKFSLSHPPPPSMSTSTLCPWWIALDF
ncbi:hypothetical protein FB45DRAFT_880169 [Roridomyces roridus]|uniref:Uncharacterized protein n=1 Tax=Roridomyces roridus TaxID=1738132 RepID=A0AAD7F8D6_9AGAR|nr:hypothetical protein FB45DRAFT_880169 [Roridomyces roridus]